MPLFWRFAFLGRTSLALVFALQCALLAMPFLVAYGIRKLGLPASVVAVRNVHVDLQLLDGGDHDFAVKAALGGNLCLLKDVDTSVQLPTSFGKPLVRGRFLSKTRAVLDR
jgi:hypothetical protein